MADITIISMGPGSPDLLTTEALDMMKEADLLIGSAKLKELYEEFEIYVPEKIIEGTKTAIKKNLDKKIGVLVTGDAGFYSLGKSIIKEFGKDNVTVIAGVSVVQLAFAKICEPWQDALFISVHGRDYSAISEAEKSDKFLLLCDNKTTASTIIRRLIDMTATHDMYVMENLASEDENIITVKSEKDIKEINDASLSVVIGIRRAE